jgi:beta-phosphoglucomutase
MNNSLKYQAIIMDMDGVLINSPQTHLRAWKIALGTLSINPTDLEILLKEGGKDEEIAVEVAHSRNINLTQDQINSVCKQKRISFETLFETEPINDILDFISELIKRKYHLALVTGTIGTTVHKILKDLLIESKFEEIITGDILTHSKPHPEPYLKACELLQVKPQLCLAIENAPAGILSAKNAGLRCVALTTSLPEEYLQQADFIFKDILLLKKWLFS